MGDFFIKRPKFAIVLSIVMTLAGLLTLLRMPISLYPDIVPPSIELTAFYPGADHNTIRDTVAAVIEDEVNGVEDMIYMSSQSNNDGSYLGTVTFDLGTDADKAQVLVQNRVSKALTKLPAEVRQLGVTVEKVSSSMLMTVNLFSPEGTYDNLYLSNYTMLNVKDALLRVKGVGKVQVIGEMKYSMRVWTNPDKMASLNITSDDIAAALASQNTAIAAGKLGERPSPGDVSFQYTIQTQGRLANAEEFENIILRADETGTIYLKDVARIELGAEQYQASANLGQYDSPLIAIYAAPGANSIEVANGVRDAMDVLSGRFPADLEHTISWDSTEFIKVSLFEVFETLIIALILVVFVTYLFLQNATATFIPVVAIPVSMIATAVVMSAMGIDINIISMFGLILSIGIVVDAAIVVLENVERLMHEEHLEPKEATSKAMKEVTAPLVAACLVLLAVFVPVSMSPGLVGQIYMQFGVTICVSTIFSTIVALTLTPALCATMLKHNELKTTGPFGAFNRFIDGMGERYKGLVGFLSRRFLMAVALFSILIAAVVKLGGDMPTDFIPEEDQGVYVLDLALAEASALDRTEVAVDQIMAEIEALPGVNYVVSAKGFSLLKNAASSNAGLALVMLDHWNDRKGVPGASQNESIAMAQEIIDAHPEVDGMAFGMPTIPGLGLASGITMQVEDLQGRSVESLEEPLNNYLDAINARPEIAMAFSTFSANVPQLFLDIDREKAMRLGVDIGTVNATLGSSLGAAYVNDLTLFGKAYQVNMSSDAEFRRDETALEHTYVRNDQGEMIRMSAFASFKPLVGADQSSRYNLYTTTQVLAIPAPGFSSGQAIAAMEEVFDQEMPAGYAYEYTGMTYQEMKAGSSALAMFGLALLFTYLFLVAQYESWTMPIAIVLAVPSALFGTFAFVTAMGGTLNLYTQVGLVLMIAMASRNAILIIEFAMVLRAKGLSIIDAAMTAARLRMRAVLMTAFAFILGVVPLVFKSGAGSEALNAIGSTAFGGMLAATLIGCVFAPVFYTSLQKLRERKNPQSAMLPE